MLRLALLRKVLMLHTSVSDLLLMMTLLSALFLRYKTTGEREIISRHTHFRGSCVEMSSFENDKLIDDFYRRATTSHDHTLTEELTIPVHYISLCTCLLANRLLINSK